MTDSPPASGTRAPTLAVIGAGAMASAILDGAFSAGVLRPADLVVAEPDDDRRAALVSRGALPARGVREALASLAPAGAALLATKPQMLPDIETALAGAPSFGGVVISILAGARSERVRAAFGGAARVVRVMPNTPARVGLGMSAVAVGAGAQTGDDDFAARLFASVGEVVRLDESLMDAFTALAGSGPAYIFYLAEAMTRAGVDMGFDPEMADTVARAVVRGSAELLSRTPEQPAGALRAAVTSKGGTTAAAIDSMNAAGVQGAIVRAIIAARDRGAELSRLV